MDEVLTSRWRVGRKLGRTLYAETGGDDRDADTVLGMVDSREVAEHIVAVHNALGNAEKQAEEASELPPDWHAATGLQRLGDAWDVNRLRHGEPKEDG